MGMVIEDLLLFQIEKASTALYFLNYHTQLAFLSTFSIKDEDHI